MAEEMENTDPPDQPDLSTEQNEDTSESPSNSEPSLPDAEPERIGFGKRLGALILDGIFTAIAAGVIGYALQDLFAGLTPADPTLGEMGDLFAAITSAGGICAVLYGLIEGFTGASPGKMILAIKIGTENSMSAETNTLLIRYAIKTSASIISLIGLVIGLELLDTLSVIASVIVTIGCFFALGATKQALHDKIAHTAVYPEDTIP